MRSRRVYAAKLERRNAELEAARDELAQKVVAEERVRIARELHDVIAHNMSVIAVQAGAGRSIIDIDPTEAKRSLAIIEETSRSALAETRRVLGLLRAPEQAGSVEPAPSLDGLDELLEGVRSAGLEVQLQQSGELGDLTRGQQLAIFRIVQEALTNVIKHSGAKKSRVVLTRSVGELRVEVVDDGAGSRGQAGRGAGLRGMRERVDAYGGRFEAGDLAEGGFKVTASIPIGAGT
jgi:signal transduction histidine kinase